MSPATGAQVSITKIIIDVFAETIRQAIVEPRREDFLEIRDNGYRLAMTRGQSFSAPPPRVQKLYCEHHDCLNGCIHGLYPSECGICRESANHREISHVVVGTKKRIGRWVNKKSATKPSIFRSKVTRVFETLETWGPKTDEDRKIFKKERMWRSRRRISERRSQPTSRESWLSDGGVLVPATSRALTSRDLKALKRLQYPLQRTTTRFLVLSEEEVLRQDKKKNGRTRVEVAGRSATVDEKCFIEIIREYWIPKSRAEALRQILVVGRKVADVAAVLVKRTGEDPDKLYQNLKRQSARLREAVEKASPQLPRNQKSGRREEQFQPYQFDRKRFRRVSPEIWT